MRFDRRVLYLVFLLASAHAAPAQTAVPPTQPISTSSRDNSPSLRLDISPQLISSVEHFASQLVSAVFAEESSRRTSRSFTTHFTNDTNTSSDSFPPVALQTTRIAAPSDPKNPAVTSSTSTGRRSGTRLFSATQPARDSEAAISSRSTVHQGRPSRTPEDQGASRHHTTLSRPANTHAVGMAAPSNSSRLNRPMDQKSAHANMTGATNTADGLGRLLTAIGQASAFSGSSTASAIDNEEPPSTNALDVLISALPTSIAAPIQSEFSDVIDPIGSGINDLTSDLFGAGDRTSRIRIPSTTSTSLTSTSTSLTTTSTPTTSTPTTSTPTTSTPTTSTPTTTPTPLPPPTSTDEYPTSTLLTRPSVADSAPASATTTDSEPSAANPSENAATVGIATGVASGVVLIGLAGLFLWRRRQQGRAPFNRSGSKRSVYPEVAWLYDPNITPPRSRAGSGSGTRLIPEPRPGSVEIGGTPVLGGASPEMRPAQPSSPLLAPVVRGSRNMTGSRSRSGSELDFDRLRPLSTLREETPRGSAS